jgi:hypothetical protein
MLPILPQPTTAIFFAALVPAAWFLTVVAEELISFFLSIFSADFPPKTKPAAWFQAAGFL